MQPDRSEELRALLGRRILILDGAMGTTIQGYKLSEADFRGERFATSARDLKGNNDLLTLTRPEVIREIHSKYLAVGADVIETNTFNSNSPSQADYGLERLVYELNHAAAKLAREAADECMDRDPSKPRFVAGFSGRLPRPRRSRPMSTIRVSGTSISTSSFPPTARHWRAWPTAVPT